MRLLNKGFNYSQDGPGNRLVYHLQGCTLRCKWCSNPEGMPLVRDGGIEMTPEAVTAEADSCRMLFFDGGGVTFTGGEPTLQHDELKETLERLKAADIRTAVETNGTDPCLGELLPFVDFLIMYMKQPDGEDHRRWTGGDNAVILRNVAAVLRSGRQLHLRVPLIRGVNTVPEEYRTFFADLPTAHATAEVLPYHEYGRGKWTTPYVMTDAFVTIEETAAMENALSAAGFTVVRT